MTGDVEVRQSADSKISRRSLAHSAACLRTITRAEVIQRSCWAAGMELGTILR